MAAPTLRVARAATDLDALLPFYVEGLGFDVLGRFADHDGFDGLMLGHPNAPWHLEFTRHGDAPAPPPPGPESLLVLYLPDPGDWRAATERMARAGFPPVDAANPYWDARGRTYADPEGWRTVLQNAAWTT
ncbi:VOC family protein [uncultured Jannaschia sp.]|uniref:VOC family protein n=1 Tax=uncultured Jannaschia sp. TaxID=293347 RepID=UPI002639357E|nr:VOC family protein [uncultured Jannaschia sp.]